jgi:hypothetical protein
VAVLTAVAGGYYAYRQVSRSTPTDLGVPVYPGARFQDQLTLGATRTVVLETADPPSTVIAFYKRELGGRTRVLEREIGGQPGAVIETETAGVRRFLTISADPETRKTLIAVAARAPG